MNVQGVWLYASDPTPNQQKTITNTLANIPRGTTVLATVALTYFTEGVGISAGTVGAAGALIPHWGVYNPDGSISVQSNVNSDSVVLVINNCAYVTFELVANYATAYAQGTLLYL